MPPLTWRDVTAPDFSSAMEGRKLAATLLNNAVQSAQTGLKDFQGAGQDAAAKALQLEALKYQDPTEYANAVASGALIEASGADPSKLTSSAITNLGARTTTLLDQATAARANELGDYNFGRTKVTDARTDADTAAELAARPAVSALIAAHASGNEDNIKAAELKYGPQVASLPPEKQIKAFNDIMGIHDRRTGSASSDLGLDEKQFNFGKTVADEKTRKDALPLVQEITSASANINDARSNLEAKRGKVSAEVFAATESELSRIYGGPLFGPVTPDSGSGLGTGDGPAFAAAGQSGGTSVYDVVLGNGIHGKPPQALSSMTMGDAVDWSKKTLIPATRAKGIGKDSNGNVVGSSAMGAYQITSSTLEGTANNGYKDGYGYKVFGDNWRSVKLDAAAQDKIAERIFNDRKNGNLKATWEGLSNSTPGAYKNMPWEQARGEIVKAEIGNGADANSLRQMGDITRSAAIDLTTKQAQLDASGISADYAQYITSREDEAEVANRLAKDPKFSGTDRAYIIGQILDITRKYPNQINAAQAGAIISRSLDNTDSRVIESVSGLFGRNLGNGLKIDKRVLADNIKRSLALDPEAVLKQTQRLEITKQEITGYQNVVAQKSAEYNAIAARVASGQTNLAPSLSRVDAELKQAQAALAGAIGRSQNREAIPTKTGSQAPPATRVQAQLDQYGGFAL